MDLGFNIIVNGNEVGSRHNCTHVLWAIPGIPQFVWLDIGEKQREEPQDIIIDLAHVVGRTLEKVLVDPDHPFGFCRQAGQKWACT